jgi:hypothetical protein
VVEMFNNILKRNKEIVAYFGITERKLMKVYIIKNKGYIYIKKFEIIKNDFKLKEKVDNNFLVYYEKRTKKLLPVIFLDSNTIFNNELCYLLKSEENRNSFKFFKISYFKYKNIIRLYFEKIIIDKKDISINLKLDKKYRYIEVDKSYGIKQYVGLKKFIIVN